MENRNKNKNKKQYTPTEVLILSLEAFALKSFRVITGNLPLSLSNFK